MWNLFSGGMMISNIFQILTAYQDFIFFAIGMMLRKYENSFVFKVLPVIWLVLGFVLFTIFQHVGSQSGLIFKIDNLGLSLLLYIVGAIIAFTVLNAVANKVNWKERKVIAFFQKHNFVIHLFHQQVIYGTITMFNGKVPNVMLLFVNFAVAMAVSLLISLVLHKLCILN